MKISILAPAFLLPFSALAAPIQARADVHPREPEPIRRVPIQERTVHSCSDAPEIEERDPARRGAAGYDSRSLKDIQERDPVRRIPPRDIKHHNNAAEFDARSPKDIPPREAEPIHRKGDGY